jgi:hypothetical protein
MRRDEAHDGRWRVQLTIPPAYAAMQSMAAQEPPALQIEPSSLGTLELDTFTVPYANLADRPFVHTRLRLGEVEYAYDRSYPIFGHSAVMPAAVAELLAEGRNVLVVERNKRYYVYLA